MILVLTNDPPRGREGIEGGGRYAAAGEPDRDLRVACRRRRSCSPSTRSSVRPVDSYLNGSQTWITDDGPGGMSARMAAAPGRGVPPARGPVALRPLGAGGRARSRRASIADALTLGTEHRTLRSMWDGLECFAAYGDDLEPAPLAQAATEALERAPDAVGSRRPRPHRRGVGAGQAARCRSSRCCSPSSSRTA